MFNIAIKADGGGAVNARDWEVPTTPTGKLLQNFLRRLEANGYETPTVEIAGKTINVEQLVGRTHV